MDPYVLLVPFPCPLADGRLRRVQPTRKVRRERLAIADNRQASIAIPQRFNELKAFLPLESWAVVARNAVLLVLLGTLAWPDVPLLRLARAGVGRLRRARPVSGHMPHPEEA